DRAARRAGQRRGAGRRVAARDRRRGAGPALGTRRTAGGRTLVLDGFRREARGVLPAGPQAQGLGVGATGVTDQPRPRASRAGRQGLSEDGRRLALAIYVPTALVAVGDGILVPTLPLFVASFESSLALVGLVLAGEAIGMLLGDVPAGWFTDRTSPKVALLVGGGIALVSVLATALAGDLVTVLSLRVIAGFGIALFNLARHAYLAEATSLAGRGRLIALYGGVNRLGGFIGPALGGAVAALLGLRAPLVLYAAVMLAAVVLVAIAIPRVPVAAGRPALAESRRAMREA